MACSKWEKQYGEGDVGFVILFFAINKHPYLYTFQYAQQLGCVHLVPADTALDGRFERTIS